MGYDNVLAALPIYLEGKGNGVLWITEEGEYFEKIRMRTVLSRWARKYCIDLLYRKRQIKEALGHKKNMPILLGEDCCLIQVLVRHAKVKGDAAYGFIRDEAIIKLKEKGKHTIITISTGRQIEVLMKKNTVEDYRRIANLERKLFLNGNAKILREGNITTIIE